MARFLRIFVAKRWEPDVVVGRLLWSDGSFFTLWCAFFRWGVPATYFRRNEFAVRFALSDERRIYPLGTFWCPWFREISPPPRSVFGTKVTSSLSYTTIPTAPLAAVVPLWHFCWVFPLRFFFSACDSFRSRAGSFVFFLSLLSFCGKFSVVTRREYKSLLFCAVGVPRVKAPLTRFSRIASLAF